MPYWIYVAANNLTLSFINRVAITGASTNFTYSFTFTPANSNRYLITVLQWFASSAFSPTVTIGGVTATLIGSVVKGTNNNIGIYRALVTTNTTQTVTASFAGAVSTTNCALYDLEGVGLSFNATESTFANTSISTTLNVPAGGAVLGGSAYSGGTPPSTSWSGITKDFDAAIGANAGTTAHDNFLTGNPSLTVSDTSTGATAWAAAIVLFSP